MTEHSAIGIITRAVRLANADGFYVLLTFLLMTVPYVWADLMMSDNDALLTSGLITLASLVPQILLTERALMREGLIKVPRSENRGYFARAFGQSLLAGLGFLIGLALLIIPGLILMARWSIALPLLIAGDRGATEALRESWDMTEGYFNLCLSTLLLIWVPAIILTVGLIFAGQYLPALVNSILFETLTSGAVLLMWFVAVALYQTISEPQMDA